MRILTLLFVCWVAASAGQFDKVKITPEMAYLYVYHKGKAVKVHRIQDTKHKISGEYAKIYRPGQDIQPVKMHKDIQTIGEVELLHFMKDKSNNKKGLIVDVRPKRFYLNESIPSAVSIPAQTKDNNIKMKKILKIFGLNRHSNGTVDASKAMDIAVYCHGLWCSKSSEFIKVLMDNGYPAEKLFYYRGGFQMWKILGFTTVKNK